MWKCKGKGSLLADTIIENTKNSKYKLLTLIIIRDYLHIILKCNAYYVLYVRNINVNKINTTY